MMASPFGRATTFLRDTREELKQVSWPSGTELVGSLLVVGVGVVLLAGFISVCDLVLSGVVRLVLR
jgi:preprotein translocase SecE subunit